MGAYPPTQENRCAPYFIFDDAGEAAVDPVK